LAEGGSGELTEGVGLGSKRPGPPGGRNGKKNRRNTWKKRNLTRWTVPHENLPKKPVRKRKRPTLAK